MNGKWIVCVALALVLGACSSPKSLAPKIEPEYLPQGGRPGMPFSEAVRVGDMLYLSGQLGTDPATNQIVSGGIAAETRQTLENIKRTLEKYGSSMDRVVKVTVMLADMSEWSEMNKIYVTYFPDHLPARSAFGTTGLAKGARLEMECIALIR